MDDRTGEYWLEQHCWLKRLSVCLFQTVRRPFPSSLCSFTFVVLIVVSLSSSHCSFTVVVLIILHISVASCVAEAVRFGSITHGIAKFAMKGAKIAMKMAMFAKGSKKSDGVQKSQRSRW